MRSRGRPDSLLTVSPETSRMEPHGGGPAGAVPIKSRRWWSRNKVAWAVTLCVLFGVLLWVSGGGLDIQPSSSSALDDFRRSSGEGARHSEPGTPPRPPPWNSGEADDQAEAFRGAVGAVLKKSAAAKGLSEAEIEEARLVAINAVKEALRKPGGLPPPSPDSIFSSACNLRVEGLPLYNSKGQRCCKVDQMTSGLNIGPQGPRGLEGEDGGGEGEGTPLPGVLRTQRTGAVEGQEVTCFPSFIIAGTQKSGTTALTGILEKHPQVMMAGRKELHFFDNKTPTQQTSEIYASNFARFNASQAMEHRAPFVSGEATPFYLASRSACMNMRKLVPDVRLVVLVRDPVKRAYSEHQMKVRRVEEQGEMLKLLPLNAKKIYDCAVEVFPSLDITNPSERETKLLLEPPAMAAAIGECSGEVGQHGKWTDLMIPFIRRVKTKLVSKRDQAAGRTAASMSKGPSAALELFREDFSRCFPLKTVAEEMEQRYPGGTWRQRWNRSAPQGARKPPILKGGGGAPFGPVGGVPTRERMEKLRVPHHRHLQYDQHQAWLAEDLDSDSAERYWNTSARAAGRGPTADEDLFGFYQYYGFPVGGDWGSLSGDGFAGERRPGADYGYNAASIIDGGYVGEGGDAFFLDGGEGFGDDGGDGVDVGRRLAPAKKGPASPGGPWEDVWGAWGAEGERVFDDTCYQRMERVTPVAQVMRAEMTKLRTCFDEALRDIGGLNSLADAPSVAAAAAIDDKLGKCFTVTPGISDQYIYRSLYGIQAYHCLKHMPRDQVLFIESDELRDKPEEVMPRVHQHIGVPDYQYQSLKQGDIMAELEKKYPDFEKRTGWRLDSEYREEIPEALAKEIGDFVAPHMKMFARLTGQTFGDWAVNDRQTQEAMVGGTERPYELFEEEFHKATARIAKAKKGLGDGRARKANGKASTKDEPASDTAAAETEKAEGGRDHLP